MNTSKQQVIEIINSLKEDLEDCNCHESDLTGSMRCSDCQSIDVAIFVLESKFVFGKAL